MSVTSYDGSFGMKQEQVARLGDKYTKNKRTKTAAEYEAIMNSPAMREQQAYNDYCAAKTSERDKRRMKTDKSFKPKDSDWTAKKAFDFDPFIDYYRVLGVDEYEVQDNIKKAYRKLSLVYHPDKAAGLDPVTQAEYQQIFIEINNAYLVLGDNPTRRQYDKKRDDQAVADEIWGHAKKRKEKAQFDAFKILEELAKKKPKPSKTVNVDCNAKVEKLYYGGLKIVMRKRRLETIDGFEDEKVRYELALPAGARDGHGILKKGAGDHHKENKPDHLDFRFRAKRHKYVKIAHPDIRLSSSITLPEGALNDPYTNVEVSSYIGGRMLLLFGRNPFYMRHHNGACTLKVAIRGEGMGKDGHFRFEVGYPADKARTATPVLRAADPVVQDASWAHKEPHHVLRRRQIRVEGRKLECATEMQVMREPLHLGTSPSTCLHFYGNLRQPVVDAGENIVQPRPMFAIVLSCPLGYKKKFAKDWQKICEAMVPTLWMSFRLLLPPTRSIQPKVLDNAPAYYDEGEDQNEEKSEPVNSSSSDALTSDAQKKEQAAVDSFFEPEAQEIEEEEQVLQTGEEHPTYMQFLLWHSLGPPEGFLEDDQQPSESQVSLAQPEPCGPPVVRGPQLCAQTGATDIDPKYKAWRLYPRQMLRVPKPRVDVTARQKKEPAMPWVRLGDKAFRVRDYWLAYHYFTQAAREAGAVDRIKGLDTDAEVEEDSSTGETKNTHAPVDKQKAALAIAKRSDCLWRLEQFHAALVDARTATQHLPKWSQAWCRVGIYSARAATPQEAWESLVLAVALDPSDQFNVEMLQKLKFTYTGAPSASARGEKIVGNQAFTLDPGKAIAHYTAALAAMKMPFRVTWDHLQKFEEEDARLLAEIYSNRAAGFMKLGIWEPAVRDAEWALQLPGREDWIKGHVRLGSALLAAGRYDEAYPHFAKAKQTIPLDAPDTDPVKRGLKASLILSGCWRTKDSEVRRARFWRDAGRPNSKATVYVISDVHFDHPLADLWLYKISKTRFQEDVLIVAGDCAEHLAKLKLCLKHLRARFRRVFFTPGNHDLWVHTSEENEIVDSIEKLFRIVRLCDELDVDIFPAAISQDVYVMPLFSWYSPEFDERDPFPNSAFIFDKYCKWPMDQNNELWRYMMYLNHQFLKMPTEKGTVITFSHFLPRTTLPFHRGVPGLVKAVGCPQLDEQIRTARSQVHIFGHSHMECNQLEDGIRYIQNPLGYKNDHGPDHPLWCVYNHRRNGLGVWRSLIDSDSDDDQPPARGGAARGPGGMKPNQRFGAR